MAYALNMVQERGRLMVEPGEKSERLLIGHAGDKFAQRLCGQTKGLHLVAGSFEFALCHAQNNESIGNLLFVCALVEPDESSNRPDLGFGSS